MFGLGHLPITSTITSITPLIVVRAVLLNGIAGIIFGCLLLEERIRISNDRPFLRIYSITRYFSFRIISDNIITNDIIVQDLGVNDILML